MPDILAFFERTFSIEIAENAALLIALVYIHSLVFRRRTEQKSWLGQLLVGLVLGAIGVMVMIAAITFEPGIALDARSVLLAIIGLFFGPVTAVVAMVVTAVFRYYQGGAGAVTGVAVIITTTLIGMLWRRWRYTALEKIHGMELYLFGVVVHLAMLLCFLVFMPWEMAWRVVGAIVIPVLVVYPLATAVLGRLMVMHIERSSNNQLLRENRAKLDRILKASNDAWWEWDLQTNEVDYSPRWWGMLGMEPNEIEPTPDLWEERLHPDDHSRVMQFFDQMVKSGRPQHEVEFRLLHKAGHYVSVISRGYVEHDDKGKAVRVSGNNVDITPLRHAIREGEHTKALLETAGRIARLGYWEYNRETNRPYWSDMTCLIHDVPTGTQPDIDDAWRFFSDGDARQLKEAWARCFDHGEAFEVKCQLNTATGRRVWVLICGEAVCSDDGVVKSLRGVVQDIDSQEKILQARLEIERNYREIFDATADAIFLHDRETGQLIDVNETMLRMYGFKSREEALKSSLAELSSGIEPYTIEQAQRNIALANRDETYVFEWHARRCDGHVFWVEVSLRSAIISGHKRLLATVRDISRRKILEKQIRQSQRLESIGRLAGGIAHDFNNMLAVIIGHTELALMTQGDNPKVRSSLEPILRAAQKSANLTRQLLTFARQNPAQVRELNLNEDVNEILSMLKRLIGENIGLNWKPGKGLWPVRADSTQVDQILANLTVNARDAITEKGQITITTANEHGVPPPEWGLPEGDYVCLAVKDNGCGMDEAVRANIFEPFFTTKEVGKGTGLGLPTVYGIMKQSGGYIVVDSEVGQGTTVGVYFPRYINNDNNGVPSSPEIVESAVGGQEGILLVEDEAAFLDLTKAALEMEGYRVVACSSPAAALALAEADEFTPDLLITDVIMPGMNGREMDERLREKNPGLKTLYMSGYSADILEAGGLSPESHIVMQKPFTRAALLSTIRSMLDK